MQLKVRVEALIVESIVDFLFASLHLMAVEEDQLVFSRALWWTWLKHFSPIISLLLLLCLERIVKPYVQLHRQAVFDDKRWDQVVVKDAFVICGLFSEHTVAAMVLPDDVLIDSKLIFYGINLKLLRPRLASFWLDTDF